MIVYNKLNGKKENDFSSFDYNTLLLNTKADYNELISYSSTKMLSQF